MTARNLLDFLRRGRRAQAAVDKQLSFLPGAPRAPEPIEAHARAAHPSTSREAAKSVQRISAVQEAIVRIFKSFGPMCDEQLVRIYERRIGDDPQHFPLHSPSGIRSRRAELADPEKFNPPRIVFSGRYQKTVCGRRTRVWTLAGEKWRTV